MVQRNLPTKLVLQTDHLKTENLFHHQDVKNNRGAADLRKKMKKSRSIKRPKQPAKPPPPAPPRQPPVGKTASMPNYMKSTTSSDARKEQSQSQVSTRNPHTSPNSSSLRRKSSDNAKLSLSSSKKATKTLLARTLTKNPSFKPARTSARKCSPAVLCENFDAQRATCSSTLKDCKFPAYLSLNPGGTESEGTSAIKVCPYTYCSLNGHHHAPLPPLKCFLSARRRMIRAQKSVKLGCLSPRRVKPVGDVCPSEEVSKDFFVEIYSKKDEDTAGGAGVDGSASDFSIADVLSADGGRDEREAEDHQEQAVEMLSDATISDEFDSYEALDENRDVESMEIGNTYLSEQNQEVEQDEEVSQLLESKANVHFDEIEDPEATDMAWERGFHSALHLDYDFECSPARDIEPDPEAGIGENHDINEFIVKSDGRDYCFDEFFVDEVCQESYAESLNSDAYSSSDDCESTGSHDHLQDLNAMTNSSHVEVQEEEAEPARDEENRILFETSFDNLNNISIPNEDAIAVTGDQVCNLENCNEEVVTLSTVDTGKEPHPEGAPLKFTEAERCISCSVKAQNAANPETGDCSLARFTAKSKKPIQDSDELGSFNPRAPNFLPLEPDPEAEKVDLRHQDLDERKNAEEWMVDYALRQVVTKLGPARKRKVALLVEAFEKVMPTATCDLQLRHGSAFDQARPIQACS